MCSVTAGHDAMIVNYSTHSCRLFQNLWHPTPITILSNRSGSYSLVYAGYETWSSSYNVPYPRSWECELYLLESDIASTHFLISSIVRSINIIINPKAEPLDSRVWVESVRAPELILRGAKNVPSGENSMQSKLLLLMQVKPLQQSLFVLQLWYAILHCAWQNDRYRTLVDTFFPQSVICVWGLITACVFYTYCILSAENPHYTCTEIRRTPSQELSNQDPFCRLSPSFFLCTKCVSGDWKVTECELSHRWTQSIMKWAKWRGVLPKHQLPRITRNANPFCQVYNTERQLSRQHEASHRPPHLKETIRVPQQFIPLHTNNVFLLPHRYCCFSGIYHVRQCMSRFAPELWNNKWLLWRLWLDLRDICEWEWFAVHRLCTWCLLWLSIRVTKSATQATQVSQMSTVALVLLIEPYVRWRWLKNG